MSVKIATQAWAKDLMKKVFKKKETYSTEETVIGTWIDGRPIYRKVFVVETSGNTGDITKAGKYNRYMYYTATVPGMTMPIKQYGYVECVMDADGVQINKKDTIPAYDIAIAETTGSVAGSAKVDIQVARMQLEVKVDWDYEEDNEKFTLMFGTSETDSGDLYKHKKTVLIIEYLK